MIINHNIPAINAHRQMGINNSNISKSLEKLSSGLGINRAADNAAGLAISEKMRGQISGLNQASKNAQDGISLIQTAEGALNETHSILQRMRELSVQSANGTYQDDVDRENIQKEVDALKSEIDRIASSTHYNNIQLLDGSLSTAGGVNTSKLETGTLVTAGTDETAVKQVYTNALTVTTATAANDKAKYNMVYLDKDGKAQSISLDLTMSGTTATTAGTDIAKALQDTDLAKEFDITSAAGTISFTAKTAESSKFAIVSQTFTDDTTPAAAMTYVVTNATAGRDATIAVNLGAVNLSAIPGAAGTANAKFEIDGRKFQVVALGAKADEGYNALSTTNTTGVLAAADVTAIKDQLKNNYGYDVSNATQAAPNTATATLYFNKATDVSKADGGLVFQIGANGTADQRVSLQVGDMSAKGIGVAGISCATRQGANDSIATIDDAINQVSGTRADLGALQNRMEHTINSLGVASENLTAAESRIRDVDMAKEMMAFTKNQILSQASQAMLAQANTLPQGVLQLLQ